MNTECIDKIELQKIKEICKVNDIIKISSPYVKKGKLFEDQSLISKISKMSDFQTENTSKMDIDL